MSCRHFRFAATLLALVAAMNSFAADTEADASWDGDGIAVATGFASGNSGYNDPMADLHRSSSGKVLFVTRQADYDGVLMWRLNADGSSDASFGGGDGVTEPAWANGTFLPLKSVRRADGQVAVVGAANGHSGVCLVPVAGTTFNAGFGNDAGCATHPFLTFGVGIDTERYSDLTNLPGNGLLVVGYSLDDQILTTITGLNITGLDENGDPLIGFGTDGHVTLQWPQLHTLTPRVTRVRNGQAVILFGGVRYLPEYSQDLYAVRVNIADGSVDGSYGDGGLARLHFDGVGGGDARVFVRDAEMLTDGSVVTGLQLIDGGGLDWVGVAKLDPEGNADAAFGDGGGRVWFRFDELFQYERVGGMTVDNQGRMLIAVTISDQETWTNGSELAMARLRPDGSFDTTFGGMGRWRMALDRAGAGSRDVAASTLYEDGRLLLAAVSDGQIGDLLAELEPSVLGFQSALFRDGLEDPLLQPEP